MANTSLIPELRSFRCLWLFPMSTLSFSANCWSRSWASQDLVRPLSSRLLSNAPEASCMTCAMQGMWFLNPGHSIPEASSVDCSSRVLGWFEEAVSVVIPNKPPSVSSKQSRMSFKCSASLAPVCWLLTYHPYLASERWKEQVINLIEHGLNFTQCPISIDIVCNDRRYC